MAKGKAKWFDIDEAVKNEERSTWPSFMAGEWRIQRAIEIEGETEELKAIKKAWNERWNEKEDAGLIRPAEITWRTLSTNQQTSDDPRR